MNPSVSAVAAHLATVAAFQTDAINTGNAKTLEVFVGITAFCFVVIMCVAFYLAYIVFSAKKELMSHVTEIKAKILPVVDKSTALINDLTPQIKEITGKVNLITGKVHNISGHVEEIIIVAKEKAHEISPTITLANETVQSALANAKVTFTDANQTVQTVNQKTRTQIDRVNGMVTDALDATTRLGKAIEYGITQPGRELAGLVAGAKATVTNLASQYGGVSAQLADKFTSMFKGKNSSAGKTSSATYRAGAQPGMVRPFGSMADRQATETAEHQTESGVYTIPGTGHL